MINTVTERQQQQSDKLGVSDAGEQTAAAL